MNAYFRHAGPIAAFGLGALIWALPAKAQPQANCSRPQPVCAARAAVYIISAFDPFASAVRIGPDLLVTNRHVVADAKKITIIRKDGTRLTAQVVPSAYQGDLALLRADKLAKGPVLAPYISKFARPLFTVAGDLSRNAVRTYPSGKMVSAPAASHKFARLHHSAYSQPGNSGGALVDDKGRLVAIVASGGDNRFDAIPAIEIAKLIALSGQAHKARSQELGAAIRVCMERLEAVPRNPRGLQQQAARALHDACSASSNRPLYDQAAQVLSRAGLRDLSLNLSKLAVARDPNAVSSRLTLVIILIFSQDYKAALPHVRALMKLAPRNAATQRYAVQIGKWGGDLALAQAGLALVRKYNPAQAQAAERFLNSTRPPPRRRVR